MNMESRTPLYLQIQEYFKALIASEKLKANERIATEQELMEQFKVSRITVVNALASLAKGEWIYRIPRRGSFVNEHYPKGLVQRHAVSSMEFTLPSKVADQATLEKKNRNLIGLIMPTIDDFFAIRLLQGIGHAVNQSCYSYVLILTHNVQEQEKAAIRRMLQIGADGMLIFPVDEEIYNEEILALKTSKYPLVLIDRYLPGVETNVVRSDGSVGAQLAVSHLYELGHREIAICSDVPLPTVTIEDRLSGYLKEMKNRGAMINPALILTDFTVDYQNIDEEHPLFCYIKNRMATAYIAFNGKLGSLIYRIAERLGLRIPEDISIVTFDNPAAGYESSVFTYISQSEEHMGRQAVRILIDIMERDVVEQQSKYKKIILVPELIINQTTGSVSEL